MVINNKHKINFEAQSIHNLETNQVTAIGINEVELLSYFVARQGKLLSKQELIDNIWTKRGVVVEESSLMNTLSTCRKAFNDKSGEVIKTERGKGYRFVADVVKEVSKEEVVDKNTAISEESSPSRGVMNYSRILSSKSLFTLRSFSLVFLSLLAGYFASWLVKNQATQGVATIDVVKKESCRFVTKDMDLKLGPSTVFSLENISIAINEENASVSFPTKQLGVYCE